MLLRADKTFLEIFERKSLRKHDEPIFFNAEYRCRIKHKPLKYNEYGGKKVASMSTKVLIKNTFDYEYHEQRSALFTVEKELMRKENHLSFCHYHYFLWRDLFEDHTPYSIRLHPKQ